MKTALFTALALAIATPALAQSQLERQLGVEAGVFTTSELAAIHAGRDHEAGDGARVTVDNVKSTNISMSSSNATASAGLAKAFALVNGSRDGGARIGQVAPTIVDGPTSAASLEAFRNHAEGRDQDVSTLY